MTTRLRLDAFLEPGFWLWVLVGVGFGFGISALAIFIVPVSALGAMFLLSRPGLRECVYGVLVGIGAALLGIAYATRGDPRKWLLAGLVLVALGVAGHWWAARPRASRA